MNILEEKKLAHNILLDIENNTKDLHLLCLQASRLALLLNNKEKAKEFSDESKTCSDVEAFLSSFGLVINDLIRTIDLKDIYNIEDKYGFNLNYRQIKTLSDGMLNFDETVQKRDPKKDIKKFYSYKQKKANIKVKIYEYALNTYYQLNLSENIENILSEYKTIINERLFKIVPDSREKLDSITKNLNSKNCEDWSNAVHTCRKLLQNLADSLYPASKDKLTKENGTKIDIGKEKYINRLICFIEDNNESKNFEQIVGSNLQYIGVRLDAIYESSNKGSHKTIQTIEEAKRYIVYTYLFIGDVLQLIGSKTN